MWLEVEYIPTSLFSFKDINATNTAATSLLFPTPYAVKMALVSEAIQKDNITKGKEIFDLVKEKEIKFKLPEIAVVNKTFGSINDLRNERGRSKPAYREYVYFDGILKIALNIEDINEKIIKYLKKLFVSTNYFGKKGSFMQFRSFELAEKLSDDYLKLIQEKNINFENQSIIQQTEDVPKDASFEAVNIYDSTESLKRKDNKLRFVVNIERTLSGDGYQYFKIKNEG